MSVSVPLVDVEVAWRAARVLMPHAVSMYEYDGYVRVREAGGHEKSFECLRIAWPDGVRDWPPESGAEPEVPVVRLSRKKAAAKARDTIRTLMAECKGSEWQILNTFNHALTVELSRIMDRMEKLRPDEWGA